MNDRPEMNYVGQCPKCGAYCMAVVDDPAHAKDTVRSVSTMIKEGLAVTRVDDAFVREHFSGCTCNSKAEKQQKLFE